MAGPSFRAAPVRVRVPATSANLGPGFDAFGLGLGLHDVVAAQVVDVGLSVDVAGQGADTVRRDARHLVVRAMHAAFDAMGGRPRGLRVVCANRIPHGRGLGSSAAAIVAGVVAARELVLGGHERLPDDAALAVATGIEGHPDNVAACLLGGLTLAWTADRGPQAVRLDVDASLAATVYVAHATAATAKVRGLLPDVVPHADAAANAARAALLTTALRDRPDLLLEATQDRLHQPYRAPAMKRTAALVERLRGQGHAAVVSGAGPSVLVLGAPAEGLPDAHGFDRQPLALDREGATVLAR